VDWQTGRLAQALDWQTGKLTAGTDWHRLAQAGWQTGKLRNCWQTGAGTLNRLLSDLQATDLQCAENDLDAYTTRLYAHEKGNAIL